jgi:DNA polymerase-3 subunit chi
MSKTRVDFYLLEETQPEAQWLFACRLAEKAYLRRHKVFIYCNHQQEAEALDELLWTFKDSSFIPHNLQGEGPDSPPPIQLGYAGYGEEPKEFSDILFNFAETIPPFHHRFKRIMEIVPSIESAKEISRQHYRQYRMAGFPIETHSIKLETTTA